MSAALRLHAASKTFANGVAALAPVDLTVAQGEFVALVGPSGCGKSTLLRLAARLEQPSSGRVERADARIGYVFQDATLMPCPVWRATCGCRSIWPACRAPRPMRAWRRNWRAWV
jgi:NitT/TauT family transport system ATP-binding protein